MIQKIRGVLFRGRRSGRKLFNVELLEQQRNDVYILMYQQMGGLR